MVTAWLFTLPAAAAVGALGYGISHLIGGVAGVLVVFALMIGVAATIWLKSRTNAVGHDNVNDEWSDTPTAPPVPAGASN
jgi:PiT family inorganic phosphate transporter